MNFSEEIRALFGQYSQDMRLIRSESTKELFTYIIKKPNNQVFPTSVRNMTVGRFYVIKYNFNGNKLWCPILTINPLANKNEKGVLESQLKIVNNKNILYALNFDYLPIKYKVQLIQALIKANNDEFDKNSNKISSGGKVKEEFNIKTNGIYNFLKNNGKKNYAITAFDITKIDKVFQISTTLLHRFVFLDTYTINNRLMQDTLNNIQDEKLKGEFSKKIKIYEQILELYEKDLETFYTSLRNFEKNLKLYEEL